MKFSKPAKITTDAKSFMNRIVRTFNLLLINVIALSLIATGQAPVRDFSREQARTSPEWVRDGVVYEIFPRTFSAEGNFNGITRRLDELQNLGVTVLWLMPIHPIGQERKKGSIGSPYAVRDFYAINPDYGTREDLRRLITEAHRRRMRVIIDIVANHTAWDSVMMSMPGFHTRNASGQAVPPVADWADVADLNYDNPQLRRYMIEMMQHWLREYDLDGFRCDVAGMIPTDFWEEARRELERVKPDILMLAEWHTPDLLVRAFDLDYSWPVHSALNDVAMGVRPATALRAAWEAERTTYPRGALHLRFSDNHDERRAIARFGERGALAASALMLTLDGVPLLYNGMEVGDVTESGAPALFERLPVFWQITERRPEFNRFYRQMVALRRAHAALRQGELEWLRNSDEARVVTYARRAGNEEFLIAVNLSNASFTGLVEAANGSSFTDVTPDVAPPLPPDAPAPERTRQVRPVALPALTLDAWGYRVFRRTTQTAR